MKLFKRGKQQCKWQNLKIPSHQHKQASKYSVPDHKSIHKGARYGDVGGDIVSQLLGEAGAPLGIVAIGS